MQTTELDGNVKTTASVQSMIPKTKMEIHDGILYKVTYTKIKSLTKEQETKLLEAGWKRLMDDVAIELEKQRKKGNIITLKIK